MINIVFENEHFVVCDKPALWLSVPDRFQTDRPCLGTALQDELQIQIFPVHRLDYEVSGLIMYAKNARAHKASQDWFQKKIISKKYRGLSLLQNFSHWPDHVANEKKTVRTQVGDNYLWVSNILRGKRRSFASPHGDRAETKAIVSDHLPMSAGIETPSIDLASLPESKQTSAVILKWDLFPITGRSHQLRFEMSQRGFPLLGDELYGSSFGQISDYFSAGPLALRAFELYIHDEAQKSWNLPRKFSIADGLIQK